MAGDIEESPEKHSHGTSHKLPDLQRRLKSRHLQMIAMGKNLELYAILFVCIFIFLSFYRRCHRHRSVHR